MLPGTLRIGGVGFVGRNIERLDRGDISVVAVGITEDHGAAPRKGLLQGKLEFDEDFAGHRQDQMVTDAMAVEGDGFGIDPAEFLHQPVPPPTDA